MDEYKKKIKNKIKKNETKVKKKGELKKIKRRGARCYEGRVKNSLVLKI
jgi:hypothetical protein